MDRIKKCYRSIVVLASFVLTIQCLAEFQSGMTIVAQERIALESEKINEYFRTNQRKWLSLAR